MSQILGNKILRFVILSMLSIILTNCGLPYCEKTRFTEDELEWTTPYNVGDSFIIANKENAKYDTVWIRSIDVNNPRNTFIFDLEGCNWMEDDNKNNAIAVFLLSIKHDLREYRCSFTLFKDFSNQPADVVVYILGNDMFDENPEPISNARPIKIGNKRMFKEALLIEKNRFSPSEYQKQIPLDYIIWDKRKGLVAYKLTEDSAPYVLKE